MQRVFAGDLSRLAQAQPGEVTPPPRRPPTNPQEQFYRGFTAWIFMMVFITLFNIVLEGYKYTTGQIIQGIVVLWFPLYYLAVFYRLI
jgi:hypothetical protein